MKSTGFGVTFTERDLSMAKRIKETLDTVDYELKGGAQVILLAESVIWLIRELIPNIESNILELLKETKAPPAPSPEVPAGE